MAIQRSKDKYNFSDCSECGKTHGKAKYRINNEIDERYHIEKSTEAACKYLKKAYEKFGNWTIAAAAYNMGRTNVIRQINRQKTDNYYDLVLGDETGRYIYLILAIKQILSDPEKFGFYVRKKDLYNQIPFYTVKVDTSVKSFPGFAEYHNTNY